MTRSITIRRTSGFCFILVLFYFTQVYPFIHFHHEHDEDGRRLAISLHSVYLHPENHADHHSEEPVPGAEDRSFHTDDHRHVGKDHIVVDWTCTKPKRGNAQPVRPDVFVPAAVVAIATPGLDPAPVQSKSRPPPLKRPFSLEVSRAPPGIS